MSSSPFVINNHPYHDTSSSSSCSSLEEEEEEEDYILLNNKSSPNQYSSILEGKKDPIYSSQRSRNNLSAKRSRVKRRMNDLVLETKLTQLTNENEILRAKIDMLTRKFGQETEQLKSTTILNILNQSDKNTSVITPEQLSTIPVKLRFKLTSDM